VVVLAAWSAQNPRILLNSATDRHPKGLGNKNGLVGKYMMCHFASGTWALFDEDMQNHMGTTGAQFMSYDRYGKTAHQEKAQGAFGSTFIVAGSALKTSDLGGFANARLDLFGPELHAFMKRAARGLTRINAFGEALPNAENRVELAAEKDVFGLPIGRLVHSYDEAAAALWNANFEEGLRIAKAAGAQEAWSARGAMPTIHLMGGSIMGTGAANSVVDSYGRSHEVPPNLGSRAGHLRDEPAPRTRLHHLRAFAARRRAPGCEVGMKSFLSIGGEPRVMKTKISYASCLAAIGISFAVLADPPKEVMNITRPDDVKFVPSPIVPGAANAVLSGDPKVPGQPYVVRNRFSPGTFSPPHFHPETRYILVLKGTWWVGSGPIWDKSKTTPVPAGSFRSCAPPEPDPSDGAKD
jgi:hypothetical protein